MSDFTYNPSFSSNLNITPRVKKAKFGDGYEQRVGDGINVNLEKWQLTFQNISNTVADAIQSFIKTKAGVTAFTWTNPEGTEITVICEMIDRVYGTFGLSTVSLMFQEVPE